MEILSYPLLGQAYGRHENGIECLKSSPTHLLSELRDLICFGKQQQNYLKIYIYIFLHKFVSINCSSKQQLKRNHVLKL